MWIANRKLKVVPPGATKAVMLSPGDEVVGFDDWGEVPKRAHLNMDWVRKVEGKAKATKANKSEVGKTMETDQKPPVTPVGSTQDNPNPTGEVAKVQSQSAEFKCEKCQKSFKSPKAVKTHTTLAHKAA